MDTVNIILDLLRKKHEEDTFVNDCKTGDLGHPILDAWVMKKSWSHPLYLGYEIKISKQDFRNDGKWIEKASKAKALTVVLTFARTDVKWWHTYVYDKKVNAFRDRVEVRFIQGRLKFENQYGKTNPAPTPSCLIIFHNNI